MGLFGSKKETKGKALPSLPTLPEMPTFPELPKRDNELPTLPTLSETSMPQMTHFSNAGLESIKVPTKPAVMEIEHEEKTPYELERLKEPIFVKIDKYREAVMNLEIIKKKLSETSNLLDKIRETRAKEEEELDLWAQEISTIKEKIEIIDKKLFGSIDQ